jgi:hypothetical protein
MRVNKTAAIRDHRELFNLKLDIPEDEGELIGEPGVDGMALKLVPDVLGRLESKGGYGLKEDIHNQLYGRKLNQEQR